MLNNKKKKAPPWGMLFLGALIGGGVLWWAKQGKGLPGIFNPEAGSGCPQNKGQLSFDDYCTLYPTCKTCVDNPNRGPRDCPPMGKYEEPRDYCAKYPNCGKCAELFGVGGKFYQEPTSGVDGQPILKGGTQVAYVSALMPTDFGKGVY